MTESLDEKFLLHIANTRKVGLLDAALIMDDCIKKVSAVHNLDYNIVYNILFTEEGLSSCLLEEKACNNHTIKECIESCNCFYLEPYGCLSRKLQDADIINEDPDKYVKTNLTKFEDLKKTVEIAAYLYYNYDGGGLTDNSYDALEYHLKKKEKIKGRAYEKIGAMPIEKIRINLRYPMESLDKIKPGMAETLKFLSKFHASFTAFGSSIKKKCCWSSKLDGVSGMAIYENGNLTMLNTRGNGIIGGNVMYLKEFIKFLPNKIPNNKNVVVRGEFIISKDVWEKKYKGSYSNARAFVSGKINTGFVSAALPDIEFVAYKLMKFDENTKLPQPSQSLKILSNLGFHVVDNGLLEEPTIFQVMELYKKKRVESEYFIDGLVLTVDESYLPAKEITSSQVTIANPQDSVAFKMNLDEQLRSTKVINVEWNISRYGRYVPVAIYEAVYTDGVRMTRATAHNAKHIQDWSMGKGTKIKILRSGDVIPQIKDVEIDNTIIPIFPPNEDNGGYEWFWKNSDIQLVEIETNREVLIKRVVHFFETINVPKLRQKTAEKFYDAGMKTPESIVRSSISDMTKLKGIGKKSAEFFYTKIRENMANVPPDRFIVASTSFKSGLGRKLLKQLFRKIPNILSVSEDDIRKKLKTEKIAGFGPSRIDIVAKGIPEFKTYLDSFAKSDVEKSVKKYITHLEYLEKHGKNIMIDGKKFVLTGFMGNVDYELEDYIYDNGGDFLDTVTSGVEAVITANVMEISKKMVKANELGITVLTIQEFSERYNVPLKRFENKDGVSKDDDEKSED